MTTIRVVTTHFAIALLACSLVVACDMGIHDGSMRQLEGQQLDEEVLSELRKIKAKPEDVVRQLGQPTTTEKTTAVSETLVYRSVRGRTSYKSTFGIKHGESTQKLIETWNLHFQDGRLADVKHSQEIQ
jgi:hypothetical protein